MTYSHSTNLVDAFSVTGYPTNLQDQSLSILCRPVNLNKKLESVQVF